MDGLFLFLLARALAGLQKRRSGGICRHGETAESDKSRGPVLGVMRERVERSHIRFQTGRLFALHATPLPYRERPHEGPNDEEREDDMREDPERNPKHSCALNLPHARNRDSLEEAQRENTDQLREARVEGVGVARFAHTPFDGRHDVPTPHPHTSTNGEDGEDGGNGNEKLNAMKQLRLPCLTRNSVQY